MLPLKKLMSTLTTTAWLCLGRRGLCHDTTRRICREAFARWPAPLPPPSATPVDTMGEFTRKFSHALNGGGEQPLATFRALMRLFYDNWEYAGKYPRLRRTIKSKIIMLRPLVEVVPFDDETVRCMHWLLQRLVPRDRPCAARLCLCSESRAAPSLGLCAVHLRKWIGSGGTMAH